MTILPVILLALAFRGICSNPRYDLLHRGGAYTNSAAFPGTLYWTSQDGDWKAYSYPGIKYANSKRFEPSTLNYDHSYFRNASMPKRGFVCPQTVDEAPYGNGRPNPLFEDCLYMDIYVPPVYKYHLNLGWAKWPVLIWIHGGHFRMGHKDAYDGGELAMAIGAIVVVPNYRVGPFGFLASGDHIAPGNWAIYDLKLALKWVHSNIEGFGGENAKVTLAGERAGGTLVSLLLLDDEVRDRVHGAITFSGNIFSPWTLQSDPARVAARLGLDTGCPNDSLALFTCLKQLPIGDLLDGATQVERTLSPSTSLVPSVWGPVLDGLQIQFLPTWLLEGPFWKLKGGYSTGYSTGDATWPLLSKIPRIFGEGTMDKEWIKETLLPSLLEQTFHCEPGSQPSPTAIQSVYGRYGFQMSTSAQLRDHIAKLTNDIFFALPAMKESSLYAKKSVAGMGNQLFMVKSDEAYTSDSLMPNPEAAFLFGQIKTSTSSNNRTVDAVTRELRRLVGHVVRHGNGFGNQFDRESGNQITLGEGHEWRNGKTEVKELLEFWERIFKLGCVEERYH